jgi:hypothetical protein
VRRRRCRLLRLVGVWVEIECGRWSVGDGAGSVEGRELVGDGGSEGGEGERVMLLEGDRVGEVVCVCSYNFEGGRTEHGKRLSVFKFLI